MKKVLQFAIVFFFSFALQASYIVRAQQILPNTVSCVKGSDPHPTTYCADATPCKVVNGQDICLQGAANPPDGAFITDTSCWSMVTDYTCLQYIDTCMRYSSDTACKEVGTRACTNGADGLPMLSSNPKLGACTSYTRHFACIDPDKKAGEAYQQTTECDTTIDQNGLTWQTTTKSSANDFVEAATAQEFARQTAKYATKDATGVSNLFPGHGAGCRTGDFGLKNCCASEGGGQASNHKMASSIGSNVASAVWKEAAGYALSAGSNFVYTQATEYMTTAMADTLARGSFNSLAGSGVGALGFGTTASSAAGMFAAEASSVEIGSILGNPIFFNPWGFAIAIAIMLIMEAMSCDPDEKELQNNRAQGLCHPIGDYCSTSFGGCMETTQSYCCYNGYLALAIEEVAHEQLGLSWGTPKDPNCGGLSPAQLSSLDFTSPAMQKALEPFKQSIMKNFNEDSGKALADGSIQSMIGTSAETKSGALCLQRQALDPKTVCTK